VAIGARMTGAGFSGCAIALVDINRFEELKEVVLEGYKNIFGYDAEVIAIDIVDGPNGYKL
jgi:galactokinase